MPKSEQYSALYKIVGERVRRCIDSDEYPTIDSFLHEIGLAKSTMSELLNGKTDVRLGTLARISAGLGMSISELLNDAALENWLQKEGRKVFGLKSIPEATGVIKKSKGVQRAKHLRK